MCSSCSCIYPSTTTSYRVHTYNVLSFDFFVTALRVQARTRRGGGAGVRNAPPSWANYFKLMQFSPETEFTPLILASKSEFSHDSHPLCENPLFRTPFLESLCTDLGYILPKSILSKIAWSLKKKKCGGDCGHFNNGHRHSNRFIEYCLKQIFVCFTTFVFGTGGSQALEHLSVVAAHVYRMAPCPFPRTPYVRNHA